MKLKQLLFLTLPILLLACDPKDDPCASIFPVIPTTGFLLIDKDSGEPLIGINRTYNLDSVNFLNTFPPFRVDEDQDTIVEFSFGGVDAGADILFNLSETEVDTIQIQFQIRQTECFDIRELEEFYYNGELIEPENGLYLIEK
jgi:hypothetical protein